MFSNKIDLASRRRSKGEYGGEGLYRIENGITLATIQVGTHDQSM